MKKALEKKCFKLEAGQVVEQQLVDLEEFPLEKLLIHSYYLIRALDLLSQWLIQDKSKQSEILYREKSETILQD